ncbi:MAG: DUF2293 domain-containing protein [Candidatus Solibacter sp.]|nr:DUF2293 domain-containing protein [Candidatus Solibacter sp.]
MHRDSTQGLEQRVIRAAEAALADHGYVSAIDVLTGMRLLEPAHVESWRKGRLDFLERMVQGNLTKISLSMSFFRQWARQKGLRPSETRYVRSGRDGAVDLRFSNSGDPEIERNYRTHFVSPALSGRKLEKLEEKLSQAPRPVVFEIIRDSECTECGAELPRDSMLFLEAEQALCLACAGMGDLEFLPAGDTALTRRATKYSGKTATVVRFSRSRGRYERQGILVESAAVEKAEAECTLDADDRARARAAKLRGKQDEELVEQMTARVLALFPRCTPREARAIAAHTATRGSGRVGRSEAGRKLEERALFAAVAAAVRHNHTNYDDLLACGVDRTGARLRVGEQVQAILSAWQGTHHAAAE